MRKISHKKKVITLVAAGAIAVAGAGAAYAYWTATGAGTGTGTVGSATTPFVITNAVPTGLVPGGSVTVNGTVTNNNATSSQFVNTVTGVVSTSGGCLASDFTLPAVPVNLRVLKAGGTQPFSATLSMADTALNQDACKGATVTITWTSN
jgi:hypothetical protein